MRNVLLYIFVVDFHCLETSNKTVGEFCYLLMSVRNWRGGFCFRAMYAGRNTELFNNRRMLICNREEAAREWKKIT
jgi:hypothetical protein